MRKKVAKALRKISKTEVRDQNGKVAPVDQKLVYKDAKRNYKKLGVKDK